MPANSALGREHVQGGLLVGWEIAFGGIVNQQAPEAPVRRFADAGLHADFGRHAGKDQTTDTLAVQPTLKARGVEHAFAGVADGPRAWRRGPRGERLVPRLATHEDAARRADITYTQPGRPERTLGRRAIGQVREMGFTRVNYPQPMTSRQG